VIKKANSYIFLRDEFWVSTYQLAENCSMFTADSTCVFLVGNQLDTQFLLWYVYMNLLHLSSNYVLILRRTIVLIQHLV